MQCFSGGGFSDFHVTDRRDLDQLPSAATVPATLSPIMDVSYRTFVLLWISAGFLLLRQKSEASPGSEFPAPCLHAFRNVCFELVDEWKTWSQARNSCEARGGGLLKMINSPITVFLKNITGERNTSSLTWWLGEGVQGEPSMESGNVSDHNCTFMRLNPLLIVSSSDCSHRRSFVCTYDLQTSSDTENTTVSSNSSRSRLKRDAIDMSIHVSNIHSLLQAADDELRRMEVTAGEPTNTSRDNFIHNMLEGTKQLTSAFAVANEDVMNHIISCSNAIFFLSTTNCDLQTNPSPVNLFEKIYEIYQLVAELLGATSTEKYIIRHQSCTIYQQSFVPEGLANATLGSEEDGYIKLPSASALETLLEHPLISTQLATFWKNPHPTAENITGNVCSMKLSDGNTDIQLTNLTEMIEIFMPRPNVAPQQSSTAELNKNTNVQMSINISDPNMTLILDLKPSDNVSLILILSQESPLTSNYSTSIQAVSILSPAGGYRWMITPEILEQTPGVWSIDIRLLNFTEDTGITVTISSFMTKCLYWDIEQEVWSTEGCQVGEHATALMAHCLCNHLTLFGSSFFVMPNYVDIHRTAELFATVTENYVVLALLCAFFGLYLVTLLWACYADRRSRSKRKMTLLEDNHPAAQYNYLIGVQTGHRKNAGTTANVRVKLTGSEGESETQLLTDPDKPVFERGSFDIFLLATPFPLGEVQHVRLQHDNTGGRPSWYVSKVTVQDLQTRHMWHFFCNCWLSADRGDGMTKKIFNAAKNNEVASFRNIFQSRTSTGFRDEHIWVSIVDPPSRSPFTRAQRVSCCMSLLLCTMAINIAFWNIPIDESSPVLFTMGSVTITWQDIMVGVQSALLMFPINILIITIFRSIRPRIISKSQKDDCENLKPPMVTIPTILKDTEEMVTLISRSPRNKLSDLPRLESTADLCFALERLHEFIQLIQGESESDYHWVYCSKFLLAGLCHLLLDLQKLDSRYFPYRDDFSRVFGLTNTLVRKAEMVFSSHMAYCPPPVKKKKRRSGHCWLPWWCVFLGWFLLLSISAVSTYFTLLYGFQYGKEKSIRWVMSLGLSLFQSIFILQPLKVIGVAVFFALLLKPVSVEESEEVEQVLLKQQDRCRQYSGRDTL